MVIWLQRVRVRVCTTGREKYLVYVTNFIKSTQTQRNRVEANKTKKKYQAFSVILIGNHIHTAVAFPSKIILSLFLSIPKERETDCCIGWEWHFINKFRAHLIHAMCMYYVFGTIEVSFEIVYGHLSQRSRVFQARMHTFDHRKMRNSANGCVTKLEMM